MQVGNKRGRGVERLLRTPFLFLFLHICLFLEKVGMYRPLYRPLYRLLCTPHLADDNHLLRVVKMICLFLLYCKPCTETPYNSRNLTSNTSSYLQGAHRKDDQTIITSSREHMEIKVRSSSWVYLFLSRTKIPLRR